VTDRAAALASVPGQIDEATAAGHHLMMEPPLPPPRGSYMLDNGMMYPGTSDPREWEAYAADQQARAEAGPAGRIGMIGGGAPAAERGAAGIAGGFLRNQMLENQEAYALRAMDKRNRGLPTGAPAEGWKVPPPPVPEKGTPARAVAEMRRDWAYDRDAALEDYRRATNPNMTPQDWEDKRLLESNTGRRGGFGHGDAHHDGA